MNGFRPLDQLGSLCIYQGQLIVGHTVLHSPTCADSATELVIDHALHLLSKARTDFRCKSRCKSPLWFGSWIPLRLPFPSVASWQLRSVGLNSKSVSVQGPLLQSTFFTPPSTCWSNTRPSSLTYRAEHSSSIYSGCCQRRLMIENEYWSSVQLTLGTRLVFFFGVFVHAPRDCVMDIFYMLQNKSNNLLSMPSVHKLCA